MSEQEMLNSTHEEDVDGLDVLEQASGRIDTNVVPPWDPGKIRITTMNFTLREIFSQIEEKDIDLSPDFQREYVWKERQKTRLIESILLGIPLPAFYFNQSNTGDYQVVDGVQRLSTVALFMRGEHRLSGNDLEYLSDLNDLTFIELDPPSIRRFKSAQIVVHVIEPQTPDEVKYDIFNRVNTLGSPLSAQEIRHAMSGPRSRAFLKELSESNVFDLATERFYWKKTSELGSVRNSGRMSNRELVLRFCAFRESSIEHYRSFPSLDSFLVNFLKWIDAPEHAENTENHLVRLARDFERAMIAANKILGSAAFRRSVNKGNRRGPINRAVFEAQANALADYKLQELMPFQRDISKAFQDAFYDPEYVRAVTVSTGDPYRVAYRLTRTREILKEVLKR
ncbi:DUF262 domain-containing protein [Acetobacter thailandicus]|uniref:DUF262 domain-containing protein n=1 Tax=Acetobacter thailandicus TaxID=1502842 RepID=A0ABT3QHG8_9PROT|nr:DUF262 domain-containing protein [Acetobacter thailandicus]MCX2564709.1 DUF262 domain-containing protein [Acetobacter thailandicus]NHN96263.1 DUF262 domain-containing protein [Acetobacter thailandicus]